MPRLTNLSVVILISSLAHPQEPDTVMDVDKHSQLVLSLYFFLSEGVVRTQRGTRTGITQGKE